MVDDERKVGVRSFQTRGLETAKLRDPDVGVRSFQTRGLETAKLRDPDVIVVVITRLRLDIALAYTAFSV